MLPAKTTGVVQRGKRKKGKKEDNARKVEKRNGGVDWNFRKNVPNLLSSGSKEVKSKISVDSHARPTAFFSLFFN